MNFLNSLYRSLFDIDWLRAKRSAAWWPTFGFLLVVVSFITVLRVGPLLAFIAPRALETVEQKFSAEAPDFSLIMENGVLRTEKIPQPYTFKQEVKTDQETSQFTLLIDTVTTSTVDISSLIADKENDMALFLGATGFSYYDPTAQEVIFEKYTDVPNGTITKDQITNGIAKFRSTYLVPFLLAVGLGLIVAMYVVRLMALAVWSAVLLILVKIKKLSWKYSEIYRVSAYASTLPLLVGSVTLWLGWSLRLTSLTLLILLYLVILEPKSEAVAKAE